MIYIIKNNYEIVLGEFEAESKEEALEQFAEKNGYNSYKDMPVYEKSEIEIEEKSTDKNES